MASYPEKADIIPFFPEIYYGVLLNMDNNGQQPILIMGSVFPVCFFFSWLDIYLLSLHYRICGHGELAEPLLFVAVTTTTTTTTTDFHLL